MTRQLIFIHGRSQQDKDARALKDEWIDAWKNGLAAHGLQLPLADKDIRFPYYGQTLFDLVAGKPADEVARVIVRGEGAGEQEIQFIRRMILEIQQAQGITDEEVQAEINQLVVERGPLNWEWVQAVLRTLDRRVPGASSVSVALATKDVYRYLRNAGIQTVVDTGIRTAFSANTESVVVSHSLGTVVAYNILRRDGQALGWKVPYFVTLGSPLAIKVIQTSMAPNKHPVCVGKWFNAMDERDVVALYPLDDVRFKIDPAIENKTDVDNPTANRHGISGYLSDPDVAKRIYDALKA
jgi:hypothetical protein